MLFIRNFIYGKLSIKISVTFRAFTQTYKKHFYVSTIFHAVQEKIVIRNLVKILKHKETYTKILMKHFRPLFIGFSLFRRNMKINLLREFLMNNVFLISIFSKVETFSLKFHYQSVLFGLEIWRSVNADNVEPVYFILFKVIRLFFKQTKL